MKIQVNVHDKIFFEDRSDTGYLGIMPNDKITMTLIVDSKNLEFLDCL